MKIFYVEENLISQFSISLNLTSYPFLEITFLVALNRHVVAKKTVEKSIAPYFTNTVTKGIMRGQNLEKYTLRKILKVVLSPSKKELF